MATPWPAMSGRGSVDGLEDGGRLSDVGARRHSETSDQACDQVGQDVAEQVGRDDHVELPRVQHELHGAGIDDALIHLHAALVLPRDFPPGFQEEAGQCLQDVGLVNDGDLLAAVAKRVLEREPYDAA